jgi:hypothetical protein
MCKEISEIKKKFLLFTIIKMLNVTKIPPLSLIPQNLVSDSVHVLDHTMHEVLPDSQVTYSYSGNNQLIFRLNTATHFLDMLDSYFRFDVTATLTDGGNDVISKALNQGGIAACFRDIEIRTPSGITLERLDRQNILYNILSNMSHSKDHVEYMLSHTGDSYCCKSYVDDRECGCKVPVSDVYIDVAGGAGDGQDILNGQATAVTFADYLSPGDVVELRSVDASNAEAAVLKATVQSVVAGAIATDAIGFRVDIPQLTDLGATGADNGYAVYKLNKDPARKTAANTANFRVTWNPFHSGFFSMKQWFPLFLTRGGLEFVFNLEQPGMALSTCGAPVSGAYVSNIELNNVRMFASLIKPSQEMTELYKMKYQSDEGLNYSFITYRHILNQYNGATGTFSEPLHVNARSCRHLLTVFRPATFEQDNATNAEMDKIGDFHRARVDRFQLVSGSDTWPRRELRGESDVYWNEAFQYYALTLNKFGSTIFDTRIDSNDWGEKCQLPSTNYAEAKRFCLAMRTDRSDSSFSGYDASINPINLTLNFAGDFNNAAGAQQNRVIQLEHNRTELFKLGQELIEL